MLKLEAITQHAALTGIEPGQVVHVVPPHGTCRRQRLDSVLQDLGRPFAGTDAVPYRRGAAGARRERRGFHPDDFPMRSRLTGEGARHQG
jgi:hypothetical protein